ncbi:conserved hypothetical protein [Perkinsus marinus ATCC 50983]|uniref:Dipeptidase n=1 Tax=Perkinsus marinus (strain ATCC 50983 / TXsc) TaxID=423536 RepID=C5KQH7_PERM5|nr:conserved hypothetical protein [Perkinsus marinus ATCC 50983]EER13253.1 conserved hypothetical protein [Perkinsus marinus ATCC 50983]|eukprot:XP_002781458.1 conserved hypothetical protein [Perkinsus marinus ATCC 50983]
MGESSCGTMMINEADGPDSALLDIGELMKVALERCATARCAVELMGQLVEDYGFLIQEFEVSYGTQAGGVEAYDDAGEALTISDSLGETWIFHVAGGAKNITESVWAARRVPKGEIAVISNNFIIGDLPLEPTDDILFNPKIREATKEKGLWNGEEPLSWNYVVGFDAMTFHTGEKEPIPAYGALRTWRIFNLANPSMGIPFQLDVRKMPFSVPVERKLTHRDFMQYFSDYYAGTEFDLSQGMLAGPWGTPYRLEGGKAFFGQIPRGISIPRTSYSFFGQPKANVKDSVGWFAVDQPMTSVYLPFRADTDWKGVDKSYKRGLLLEFDDKSAFWAFQFVSNWLNMNFKNMSEQVVFPMRQKMQDLVDIELAKMDELAAKNASKKVEKAQSALQKYVVDEWWSMGKKLIAMYNDGYYNRLPTKDTEPALGVTFGVPNWYAHMIGFTNDIHPIYVSPAEAPINRQSTPPGYVKPEYKLPKSFNKETSQWGCSDVESLVLDGGLDNESMGQCADLDIVQALQKTKKELLDRRVTAEPVALEMMSSMGTSASATGIDQVAPTNGNSWGREVVIGVVFAVVGVAVGMLVEKRRAAKRDSVANDHLRAPLI